MRLPERSRRFLGVPLCAFLLLAGCGTTQNQPSMATAAPALIGRDLIYATGGCGGVCVISYPAGKLEQSIRIGAVLGCDCSDSSGNVFVTAYNAVLEYAHGRKSPIATLRLPGNYASGCSIDPATGNLAVVYSGSGANIAIFPGASGTPTVYSAAIDSSYCGYDADGDLFVSGYNGHEPALSELPKGSTSFFLLPVSGNLGTPGEVQWDGSYITFEAINPVRIFRLRISGSSATIIGTTHLRGDLFFEFQSWIYGGHVFVPYGQQTNRIGVWAYPKGGEAITKLTHLPISSRFMGVTISRAKN